LKWRMVVVQIKGNLVAWGNSGNIPAELGEETGTGRKCGEKCQSKLSFPVPRVRIEKRKDNSNGRGLGSSRWIKELLKKKVVDPSGDEKKSTVRKREQKKKKGGGHATWGVAFPKKIP